jgi:hypothetical protein
VVPSYVFDHQSKTNISALSLMRYFVVGYPTAWLLKHKLMQTMDERENRRQLKGRIIADDIYLGGVTSGGKRGRGAKKDGLFIAVVEADLDSSVRYVRFDHYLISVLAVSSAGLEKRKRLTNHT